MTLTQRRRPSCEIDVNPVSQEPTAITTAWIYKDLQKTLWDCQPACFITDYVLGTQCFLFGIYSLFYSESDPSNWHSTYFFSIGASAALGGVVHHLAFNARNTFDIVVHQTNEDGTTSVVSSQDMLNKLWLFGLRITRETTDQLIQFAWRLCLGFSCLSHFALFSLSAERYLSENIAFFAISIAATCYAVFGIWSSVQMDTFFMLVGFVPALLFLGYASFVNFHTSTGASHGILALAFKLSCGIVQSLGMSPSENYFNHNALAHVLLSVAVIFILLHCVANIV